MKETVYFQDLGRQAYKETWDYQEALLQKNVALKTASRLQEANSTPQSIPTIHHLLFVEHPPVYTLGRNGKQEHVLIAEEDRIRKGIDYYHSNRGGDITFHGPQQLVGYPMLDLERFKTDLGWYLRSLEEVIILTLAAYGLQGERSAGETGVWLDASVKGKERKICAMGIRCSRWITMHGFALNVNTDLSYFDHIIPCGIENKQVTSLQKELGQMVALDEVKQQLLRNFENVFQCVCAPAEVSDTLKYIPA